MFYSDSMIQTQATLIDIQHSPNKQVAFLYFKVDDTFSFQEGQFVFLERLWFSYPDGKAMKNAYSIGTTNHTLQKEGIIGTIVKKSSEWWMSEYLTQTMKIGDKIKCTWPLWHFFDKGISKYYLFVSIGSGITPLFSMYTKLLQTQEFDKIINVFWERTKDLLLPSVMQAYDMHTSQINNLLYLSQETALPENRSPGRIQQWLQNITEKFDGELFQAFICGKPVMVDEVVALLLQQWVPRECISFEKY